MNDFQQNTQITDPAQKEATAKASDVQAENKPKRNKALVILFLSALLCGGVLATLRSLILFGGYDNRICLYPNGTLNTALGICTVLFGVVLSAVSFVVLRGEGRYKVNCERVGMIFSQSLASFSFAALGFSVVFIAKKAQVSLSTLDSVLIALSLVGAVAFFSEAFANKETLGVDASVVLKLFASACCLFITFYFYFDQTTAIHNSNKKFATLAFAAALLSIFYGTKAYIKKTNKAVFVAVNLLCVCYCVMYSVPNLVWYFKMSSPLLLNVFFDVVCLALGILSGVTLLSFERVSGGDEKQEDEEEETSVSEACETDEPQTELETEKEDGEPVTDEPCEDEEK